MHQPVLHVLAVLLLVSVSDMCDTTLPDLVLWISTKIPQFEWNLKTYRVRTRYACHMQIFIKRFKLQLHLKRFAATTFLTLMTLALSILWCLKEPHSSECQREIGDRRNKRYIRIHRYIYIYVCVCVCTCPEKDWHGGATTGKSLPSLVAEPPGLMSW